jgi:acetyl-CoA/propionyl-CoA carboxylase biotin carboxyl carrier protein
VGYPLLIKPSAGGGGKGMTVVESAAELPGALATARRVATAAFGDGTLLLERLVRAPRHIEVQVLADTHGTTIHLGERECSLQRRHQKVIEEAPSPLFATAQGASTRARIGAAACEAARSVGYVGAGTVEFLVSDEAPDEFFFMEMNTRLQVEHPVTEMVTGVDLVEQQLRVAAGQPLALRQEDLRLEGHAIEARVYAEVPARDFLPATGRVELLHEPAGEHLRVDSSLREGLGIGSDYDPMLAKCIAWGSTRAEALETLDDALARYTVLGVETNIEYLRLLLADEDVRAGHLDTTLIERRLGGLSFRTPGEAEYAAAALLATGAAPEAAGAAGHPAAPGPWASDGWRLGAPAARRVSLGAPDGGVATVALRGPAGGSDPSAVTLRVDLGTERGAERTARFEQAGEAGVVLALDGGEHRFAWALAEGPDGERTVHLGDAGWSTAIPILSRAERLERLRAAVHRHEGEAAPEVRTPMPGTVVSVAVDHGQAVEAGQPLVSVEAMKMEHQLVAALAGTVALHVTPGALVKADQVVATVTPHEATPRAAHEGA